MWEPAISGMEKAHNCADLSYRRIRRYLVWRLKRLEARDFSRVRIKFLIHDLDYEELTDYRKLYKYLKKRLIDGKMTYIFLDEIQNVTDFPKVLDSLYIKKNIDIYVTGSNAYMLSSEIATMISGRYIQIEMLPLSFKEYMESTGSMNDRGIKYAEYLQNSSFPFTLELKNQPDEIRDYLEGIYNTIVVKDIINRKKITDTMMLKSVLRFVFDNIGNPLSSKKIADTMTSDCLLYTSPSPRD